MLKAYFTFILLTVLAVRPIFFLGNVVYFQAHIDTIVEKYCVNKSKPQLNCNGKCHLSKQINVDVKDSQPLNSLNISEVFFPVFFQEYDEYQFCLLENHQKKEFKYHTFNYKYNPLQSIYKPPIV